MVFALGEFILSASNPKTVPAGPACGPRTTHTIGTSATRAIALLAVALLFAIGAAGCGDDKKDAGATGATSSSGESSSTDNYGYPADEPRKNSQGELLPPPVQIYGGVKSGKNVSKNTVVVVNSQKQYEKLQKEIFKGQEAVPIASTDFKSRQMIFVFLKPENNGAQAQVTTVRKGENTIIVTAVRLLPGNGCPGATKKTEPYSIVETDRLKGEPKLKIDEQQNPPC